MLHSQWRGAAWRGREGTRLQGVPGILGVIAVSSQVVGVVGGGAPHHQPIIAPHQVRLVLLPRRSQPLTQAVSAVQPPTCYSAIAR